MKDYSKATVTIIDDEEAVGNMLKTTFEVSGFKKVRCAPTIPELTSPIMMLCFPMHPWRVLNSYSG